MAGQDDAARRRVAISRGNAWRTGWPCGGRRRRSTSTAMPCSPRYARTHSINARLDSRLVVSKLTSFRINSSDRRSSARTAMESGRTCARVAGAFMAKFLTPKKEDSTGRAAPKSRRPPGASAVVARRTQSIARQSILHAERTMSMVNASKSRRRRGARDAGLRSAAGGGAQSALPLDRIKLPPGFIIETVARVPNAREHDLGRARHALRRLDQCWQGVRGDAEGRRRRDRARHCLGLARAGGRRLSQWRALRLGHQPHPALRRHREPPRQSARAGRRERSVSDRWPSRPEVHRLRARRQAVRARRRAVQHLRARSRALHDHHAHECRRQRTRDRRARHTQFRRLRLASA